MYGHTPALPLRSSHFRFGPSILVRGTEVKLEPHEANPPFAVHFYEIVVIYALLPYGHGTLTCKSGKGAEEVPSPFCLFAIYSDDRVGH